MAVFKEITAKEFLEKYNGIELFKEFAPKIAKLPSILYKPYYNKKVGEVAETLIKLGKCTKAEADALEKAFNDRYGNK